MGPWGTIRPCLVALASIAVITSGLMSPGGPAQAAAGKPGAVSAVRVGEGRTDGNDARLIVRWKAAAGATSYQVFYAGSRSMTGARSIRTTNTAIAVRGLRADRSYCVRVLAVKRVGKRLVTGPGSPVVCARTPKPVRASRPVWVTAQEIVTGTGGASTTTLTLRWPRTTGATSYDLLYAPAADVFRSRHRKVRTRIPRSGGALETVTLNGLSPGRKHCFRIRGRSSTGVGTPSPLHCKITMPAARKLVPTNTAVKIATFNVCGKAETCQRWDWATRRPLVEQHILASGADVVAIQEGRLRLADIEADLRGSGFVKACVASGAQAVFVRSSVYAVVAGTADGIRFTDDPSHGGCWVRLRHKATSTHLVVSSLHLFVGNSPEGTRARARQTAQVLVRMEERYGVANAAGTPAFVLAGDFNSHRGHTVDAPLVRLARAGFHDAYDVAATYRAPYRNSVNRYQPVPARSVRWGSHVDRVFVPKGASVTGWRTVSRLSKGRYVTPMPSDHHPVAMTVYLPAGSGCNLLILCR